MGGLWVDYDLQTTVPGLFAIGEANFSDHGANRLGASALMQGLGDGYFVLPSTINDYLARHPHQDSVDDDHPEAAAAIRETRDCLAKLLAVDGDRTPDSFHREIGELMWEYCGMARTDAGLRKALARIPEIREEFWRRIKVPGSGAEFNQSLEKANRIVDYLELAELMCLDALHRAESCGGHFREESQTPRRRSRPPRRGVRLRGRLGVPGHRRRPRPAQGRPRLRVRPPHPAELRMKLTLRVWRQHNADAPGAMASYEVDGISQDMSFLEMLDTLNEDLILRGEDPVAFDHDCREGICGACSLVINGDAHGPERTTTCQLHMRSFADGDTIDVEPWRASAFPVVKDLVVDRSAFDRIIQAGGYITAPTGAAPEAHATPVPKPAADHAFEHAECIGCGACVAACPNGSAMLFTSAKINHLNVLPQGLARARIPGPRHGGHDGRRGLRRLHPDRRMRHGLPQGHPAALDRRDEQGVAARSARADPPPGANPPPRPRTSARRPSATPAARAPRPVGRSADPIRRPGARTARSPRRAPAGSGPSATVGPMPHAPAGTGPRRRTLLAAAALAPLAAAGCTEQDGPRTRANGPQAPPKDALIMVIRHAEHPYAGATGEDAEGNEDPGFLAGRGWRRAAELPRLFPPGRRGSLPRPAAIFAAGGKGARGPRTLPPDRGSTGQGPGHPGPLRVRDRRRDGPGPQRPGRAGPRTRLLGARRHPPPGPGPRRPPGARCPRRLARPARPRLDVHPHPGRVELPRTPAAPAPRRRLTPAPGGPGPGSVRPRGPARGSPPSGCPAYGPPRTACPTRPRARPPHHRPDPGR
ncbi:hypothetical protein GCM10020254_16280 [Streptomyces goshikiensis]